MNAPVPPDDGARPWQPKQHDADLHASLLQVAARALVRSGGDGVSIALSAYLVREAHWQQADATALARQVAAEAATWSKEQEREYVRAAMAALLGDADELDITEKQRRVRAVREAMRREDKREDEESAAAEGPVVIRSGEWLSTQRFGPVVWAVPGLIPEGVTILSGPPKGGKSWLVLSVALSLASGGLILGALRNGPPRPVLYLALEDSDRRMKQRCAELGYEVIPRLFDYITECRPGRVIEVIAAWMGRHPGQRPLVIIDTWGKISMPAAKGETIYERDYRLGGQVKSLAAAEPGASVWVNHHVRKQAATDFLDTVSGTAGVAGSADTVAVLARKRGEYTGRLHITGRDVEEDTYQLAGFPFWELEGGDLSTAAIAARAAAERDNLGERSAQILDLLAGHEQQTTGQVAQELGISSDQASVYLRRLADSGKIRKDGRGIWKPFVPPVGSVGSVGGQNQHNRGYVGPPPQPDFGWLAKMAEQGLRKDE